MALDAEDQARLGRIESDLVAADPALAMRFRSWRPSAQQRAPLPGWTVVPGWMTAVFLVGFTGWMLSPGVGTFILLGIAVRLLWKRAADRVSPPRAGLPDGGGWSRRPGRGRRGTS